MIPPLFLLPFSVCCVVWTTQQILVVYEMLSANLHHKDIILSQPLRLGHRAHRLLAEALLLEAISECQTFISPVGRMDCPLLIVARQRPISPSSPPRRYFFFSEVIFHSSSCGCYLINQGGQ